MADAVHAITPVSIAHRKNSNQRVILILMSPPAPLHTKSLYFRSAFRKCISDLCPKNSQQKLCRLCNLPGCQGIFRRGIQRNIYAECRARNRRLFHRDVASVILQNLLHHRQSHPGPILLAVAHKRLEQPVTHRLRDPWTVILDANFQTLPLASQPHVDFPGSRRQEFRAVPELGCCHKEIPRSPSPPPANAADRAGSNSPSARSSPAVPHPATCGAFSAGSFSSG